MFSSCLKTVVIVLICTIGQTIKIELAWYYLTTSVQTIDKSLLRKMSNFSKKFL